MGEFLYDVIMVVGKDKIRLLVDLWWFNVVVIKVLFFKNKILMDMLIDVNFKIFISLLLMSWKGVLYGIIVFFWL